MLLWHQEIIILTKSFAMIESSILKIQTLFTELIELNLIREILAKYLTCLIADNASDIIPIYLRESIPAHCKVVKELPGDIYRCLRLMLTIICDLGVTEIPWNIVFEYSQCDIRILPSAYHGVIRLDSSLGLLHGHLRVEGPKSRRLIQ